MILLFVQVLAGQEEEAQRRSLAGLGEGVVSKFTIPKCNRKSYNQLRIGEVGEAEQGCGRAGRCGAWASQLLPPGLELLRRHLCCEMYRYES